MDPFLLGRVDRLFLARGESLLPQLLNVANLALKADEMKHSGAHPNYAFAARIRNKSKDMSALPKYHQLYVFMQKWQLIPVGMFVSEFQSIICHCYRMRMMCLTSEISCLLATSGGRVLDNTVSRSQTCQKYYRQM